MEPSLKHRVNHLQVNLKKVCLGAYPVIEYKGLAFTYMGPADKTPPFPFYDTFDDDGDEICLFNCPVIGYR